VYVDDMVDAMVTAMERADQHVAINIASGELHSVREILALILELDGYADARVVMDPSRPRMIPEKRLDTARARHLLGFTARIDLRDGLRRTIDWYRQRVEAR
jgi:GDP-L-fucose synthase